MTTKLLNALMQCFDDSYVSVRVEACRSSGLLGIKEHLVIDKLVYLVKFDSIWKVKVVAMQGLYLNDCDTFADQSNTNWY